MLRGLLRLGLALLLLWSLWWALASWGLQQGIVALDRAPTQQGWQTSIGAREASGFPLRIGADLTQLLFEAPREGLRVALPSVSLSAPTYWPGDVTLSLPNRGIEIEVPGQTLTLRLTDATARLRTHPGLALPLDQARVRSGPWQVNSAAGNLLSGQDMLAEVVEADEGPNRYLLTLQSDSLSPGDLLRGPGLLDPDLPDRFDSLDVVLALTFAAPLDRYAAEGDLPPLRAMEITALDIHWGPLRLTGGGALAVDAQGIPDGQATLTIANWEELANLVARLGLDPQLAQMRLVLQAMANVDGDPQSLTLPLRFEAGQMFLGDIALGPAPRLTY
ncbi:MAG: DUF2125 domain-containing protein [Sulfitobacter sp.]|nr:DUF2125 domain-containing protein [Sulfitobacter sp.]